jgi:hypothetical protein
MGGHTARHRARERMQGKCAGSRIKGEERAVQKREDLRKPHAERGQFKSGEVLHWENEMGTSQRGRLSTHKAIFKLGCGGKGRCCQNKGWGGVKSKCGSKNGGQKKKRPSIPCYNIHR